MEIQKTNFGTKKYLAWKKTIKTTEISDRALYDEGYKKIFGYIEANKVEVVGVGAVLYFSWDEVNDKAEIALGMPVNMTGEIKDSELSMVEVPESKALMAELKGSYDGLKEAHSAIMAKIREEKLDNWLAIEEYLNSPASTKTEDLQTRVFYLYK